jgi:hypothetical protein
VVLVESHRSSWLAVGGSPNSTDSPGAAPGLGLRHRAPAAPNSSTVTTIIRLLWIAAAFFLTGFVLAVTVSRTPGRVLLGIGLVLTLAVVALRHRRGRVP